MMIIDQQLFSRDDFMQMDIVREGDTARIITQWLTKAEVDALGGATYDAEIYPVRLLYFIADADLSDYEILEAGYEHYLDLICAITGSRRRQ